MNNCLAELWTETSGPEKNGCTKIVHKDLRVMQITIIGSQSNKKAKYTIFY